MSTTFQPEDGGELSLRPHTLKEYIGQAKAKENLYIFIEAARRRTNLWIMSCSMALRVWEKLPWPALSRRRWV